MKKKYNPFRMWESYVFSILSVLIVSIINLQNNSGTYWFQWFALKKSELLITAPFVLIDIYYTLNDFLIYIVLISILGFFIGWGIHLLIRKLKK